MEKLDAIILVFSKAQPKKKVEKKLPKYIVPFSNFNIFPIKDNREESAMITGIACEVVSEPYNIMHPALIGEGKVEEEVIDVVSLLTGIKYTIPNSFYKGYETREEAVYNSEINQTQYYGDVKSLIGRTYYPKDNSFICDFDGNYAKLYGKPCKVVSIPFKGIAKPLNEEIIYKFILVEYEGKIYRTLFGEWNFYPHMRVN